MAELKAEGFKAVWANASREYRRSLVAVIGEQQGQRGLALLKLTNKDDLLDAFDNKEAWCLAELAPFGVSSMAFFDQGSAASVKAAKGKTATAMTKKAVESVAAKAPARPDLSPVEDLLDGPPISDAERRHIAAFKKKWATKAAVAPATVADDEVELPAIA